MRKLNLLALLVLCLCIVQQATAQPSAPKFVNYKSATNAPAILTTSNAHFGTLQWFNANRINSRNRETSPVFFNDKIVFMSTRRLPSSMRHKKSVKGDNYFTAKVKANGKIRTLNPLAGEINKYKKNGPVSFSPTGLSIFFARQATSQSGHTIYKISYAQKKGKYWKKVKDLPVNDLEASSIHPFLSPDASRIYFASDRLGGFGGMDIYVSYYKKGHWTIPLNLGPEINSDKDEVYPVLGMDGILYFASDRDGGHGGLDLYKATDASTDSKDNWKNVANLGFPFNSSDDDFGILIDKNLTGGFFTSNRPGGEGQEDIYRWSILNPLDNQAVTQKEVQKEVLKKKQTALVKIEKPKQKLLNQKPISLASEKKYPLSVLKIETDKLRHHIVKNTDLNIEKKKIDNTFTYKTGQKITLSNISNNKNTLDDFAKAELDFVANILKTNPQIVLEVKLPKAIQNNIDIKNYLLSKAVETNRIVFEKLNTANKNAVVEIADVHFNKASKSSAYNVVNNINTSKTIKATPLFALSSYSNLLKEKLMLGKNTKLTKIHYDYNQFLLDEEAKLELDRIVKLMKQYKSMEISVQSHTDASGSARYNEKLSARRAYATRDYLISKGIDGNRIKVEYFGEQKLIFHCKDAASCSEEGQRLNRRTEIKITNIDIKEINF